MFNVYGPPGYEPRLADFARVREHRCLVDEAANWIKSASTKGPDNF